MEHEHEHEFVLEIPEFEHLSYEVEEGIALVTLKRPEALNALSQSLLEELAEIPELVQQDPEVRAVIFTGEGKAFAAGADLKEIAAIKDPFMGREDALFGQRVFDVTLDGAAQRPGAVRAVLAGDVDHPVEGFGPEPHLHPPVGQVVHTVEGEQNTGQIVDRAVEEEDEIEEEHDQIQGQVHGCA